MKFPMTIRRRHIACFAFAALASASRAAWAAKSDSALSRMSNELVSCVGEYGGQKQGFTVYRSMDLSNAAILHDGLLGTEPPLSKQRTLFSGATVSQVGNTLRIDHDKIHLTVDLASEEKKVLKGRWDETVELSCRVITPMLGNAPKVGD